MEAGEIVLVQEKRRICDLQNKFLCARRGRRTVVGVGF